MINPAPISQPAGPQWSSAWSNWFSQAFLILQASSQSGTTADRPTKGLYVGRTYFDTTIGKPIWYEGPGWVDATGTGV
jgi:hypothetical protein